MKFVKRVRDDGSPALVKSLVGEIAPAVPASPAVGFRTFLAKGFTRRSTRACRRIGRGTIVFLGLAGLSLRPKVAGCPAVPAVFLGLYASSWRVTAA